MDDVKFESVLQEMGLSLPAVQADISVSDDEDDAIRGEGEDNEESVSIFCRTNHFLSAEVVRETPSTSIKGEETSGNYQPLLQESADGAHRMRKDLDESPSAEHSAKIETNIPEDGAETEKCITDGPVHDKEWKDFQTDFEKQLEKTDKEIREDESAFNSHLEVLSEILSAGLLGGVSTEQDEISSGQVDEGGTVGNNGIGTREPIRTSKSDRSIQKQSEGPLTTDILADINMSALDKALDEIVNVSKTNEIANTSSTEGHHPLPPRRAWEESQGSSPDLMSKLTAISNSIQTQTGKSRLEGSNKLSQNTSLTETAKTRTQQYAQIENGKVTSSDGKKTVFLDLRPLHTTDTTKTAHHTQSISESEESDDALVWAQKRREMKSSLSPLQHSLRLIENMKESSTTSCNNISTRNSQTHQSLQEHETGVDRQWKTAESKRKKKKNKRTVEDGGEGGSNEAVGSTIGVELERDSKYSLILQAAGEASASISIPNRVVQEVDRLYSADSCESSPSTDSLLQSSTGSNIQGDSTTNTVPIDKTRSTRKPTTDSLTLSEISSFSEGEPLPDTPLTAEPTVINPAVSINSRTSEEKKLSSKKTKRKKKTGGAKGHQVKDAANNIQPTADSSPEMGRAELGTKPTVHSEEIKKGEKKRKEGGSKSKKKKKGDSKKKKMPTLRIHYDSLTTSSDEERGLDSPQLNRVDELVETSPEKKEESEERLKQWLEYRIMAKKPPTTFETPATEPLFHKDVSFSPVLTHTYPSVTTDALLVLPLSATHGLVSLPIAHDKISPEAHLHLHLLLLSTLANSAAQSYLSPHAVTGRATGRSPSPSNTSARPPFRITALYQTTLDGQLSILIGASLPQGRKRSMSYPSVVHRGPKKRSGKLTATVLSPLEVPRNPLVVELEDILYRHKLSDFLSSVLSSSTESTEGVTVPRNILSELEPILDMSAHAFFLVHSDTEPLNTPTSFYWHSLYQPSCLPSSDTLCSSEVIQSTVCVLPSHSLSSPPVMFGTLFRAYENGLSIAGMRLVYGEQCSPVDLPSPVLPDDTITDASVCVVLCLRGPDAVSRCMDLVGPEDHSLACVTDPLSLMAQYGSPAIQPALCVRTVFRANAALARWFGGRACLRTGTVLGMNDSRTRTERRKRQRVRFSESEFESEDNSVPPTPDVTFPPLVANRPLLTVHPYKDLLLVISPLLPPLCYGPILATCSRMGFTVSGIKRMRLNSKRAALLDIPESFLSHYTPSSTPPSPNLATFSGQHPLEVKPPLDIPPLPSLLLVLSRENALVFGRTLRNTIISDLQHLLSHNSKLENCLQLDLPVEALLHTVSQSSEKLKILGSFSSAPITSVSSLPQLAPGWEREGENYGEEIAFLAMTQASGLSRAVELLHLLFQLRTENGVMTVSAEENVNDLNPDLGGFEILGIKFIPQLSRFHAKQLCPVQSANHAYQEAIELLSGSPALVLVLRGIACNRRLSQFLTPLCQARGVLSHGSVLNLSMLFSDSLSQAFHFTTLFFTDKELFCDPGKWLLLSTVPSPWARADVLSDLQNPPSLLHSLVVVRGGEWRLLVKVVGSLHRAGFEVCGITMRESSSDDPSSASATMIKDCSEVAVCVSRQNAVWYLNNHLKPFTSSSSNGNKLHYPSLFSEAVTVIKQYFPRGLCSRIETDYYGINSFVEDDFSGLTSSLNPSLSTPSSPITETTCLILPHTHLTPSPNHPTPYYLQLLELLALAKFTVRGIQLARLSRNSTSLLEALGTETKSFISGPCLVVVLRRDNAASCFKYILQRTADEHSVRGVGVAGVDVEELLRGAVVPDSAKSATAILTALVKEE